MPTFRPGYDAHWIQARQAFENNDGVELACLLSIDTDNHELVVRTKAGERRYWCARAADASDHLDHALVVPRRSRRLPQRGAPPTRPAGR